MTAQSSYHGEDASLPVAVAGSHARMRGLIALTDDQPLIRALQDLAATGTDISVVSNLQSFTDEMLQHAGHVALIDAAALDTPIGDVVDAIRKQLPDMCLMVAGHSVEQQQLASRISSQTVFRFLHKPASTQRLKLFLEAAARPLERSVVAAPTPAATKNSVVQVARTGGGKPAPKTLGIGIAVVIAVALGTWLLWPKSKPAADETAAAPVANAAVAPPAAAAMMQQASAAFAAGKFVASDGSSAAELYRSALKLEPGNAAAKDGYSRSIDQALHKAEEALLAGKFNDAGNVAAAVQLIESDNARLGFLNTQIAREMARANADASQRQELESRQTQIRTSLAAMKERLQAGALIDPAARSAVASFREAEAIGANEPVVRSARETLVSALLTAADARLDAREQPEAKRLVDAAGSINSSASGLDVMRRRLEEAVVRQAAPDPVAAPPRVEARVEAPAPAPQPQMVAPVVQPATAAAAPAQPAASTNEIVAASKLKVLRREQAVYPEWALQQLVSGWVEMDFTVAKDGSVKDIIVTSAQPKGTFNNAATKALARYHYEPVVRDGVAVTQRAHIRLGFSAQDAK